MGPGPGHHLALSETGVYTLQMTNVNEDNDNINPWELVVPYFQISTHVEEELPHGISRD
jgi:hypothetical protein